MNRADLLRRLAQNQREAAANQQALAEILEDLARDEPAAPPAPTAAPSTVNAVDYLLNAGIAKGRAFKALRDGRITGALKQGMRWLASPASLDAWIESTSTRPSPKVETGGRLAALMNYGPR